MIAEKLQFLTWLPSQLALLTDAMGNLFVANVQTKKLNHLGMIIVPQHPDIPFVPSCATLTLDHLIIGSQSGTC